MEDHDFYVEAIAIAIADPAQPLPHEPNQEHIRALWNVENAMTLRLVEVHSRAQQAELMCDELQALLKSLRTELHAAARDRDQWKARALKTEADLEDALGHVVVPVEPDCLDLGKRYNREQDEAHEAHEERQKGAK